MPPALLSLILPAGQWLAFSWTSITTDREIFQLDLIILKVFSNESDSLILFCVLPGASGLLRDKAAAGLRWLFPPCSSQPPARSSALWKAAGTDFLMKRGDTTRGLLSLPHFRTCTCCSNCTPHCPGLFQGTGCPQTAPDPLSAAPSLPEEFILPKQIS